MGLGVLNTRDPNVPGTVNVLEEEGQPKAAGVGLKKHGNIILVPQPSDDPNDPLVGMRCPLKISYLKVAELAIVEERCDSSHSLPHLLGRIDAIAATCCKYHHSVALVHVTVHGGCAPDRIPPPGCRRCRFHICRIGKSMGKEASLSSRHTPHHYQQRMGRGEWKELYQHIVGKDYPGRGSCAV